MIRMTEAKAICNALNYLTVGHIIHCIKFYALIAQNHINNGLTKEVLMSRSRKKHPLIQGCGDKSLKKIYNRRFRHQNDLDFPSGNAYRKTNDSWEICDILFGYFRHEDVPNEDRKYWYAMK